MQRIARPLHGFNSVFSKKKKRKNHFLQSLIKCESGFANRLLVGIFFKNSSNIGPFRPCGSGCNISMSLTKLNCSILQSKQNQTLSPSSPGFGFTPDAEAEFVDNNLNQLLEFNDFAPLFSLLPQVAEIIVRKYDAISVSGQVENVPASDKRT